MATKAKGDVKVLKRQEAEDAILQYMKKMNRPFDAVDISANLKGAVPKATTVKLLVGLAEKGAIAHKIYGNIVLLGGDIETLEVDELAALEVACKSMEVANDAVALHVKHVQSELTKIKNTSTDAELDAQVDAAAETVVCLTERLTPVRSGVALISSDDLAQLDTEWGKWRPEWAHRKKVFVSLWQLATDALPLQDTDALAEDLGIEFDTPEHAPLERGLLCAAPGQNSKPGLKRKRE